MSKHKPEIQPVVPSDAELTGLELLAPEEKEPTQKEKEPETPRQTKARALVDLTVNGVAYRSGSLIEAEAEIIASLGDQVDTHPDAAAYCEATQK